MVCIIGLEPMSYALAIVLLYPIELNVHLMEQHTRLELVTLPWQGNVLPLN